MHMSGLYGGVLFSVTTYDANNNMFPPAFGVMSLENYNDWCKAIGVATKDFCYVALCYPLKTCSFKHISYTHF